MASSQSIMDYNISYWNGVIYGPPGVGKTIFAGTSQKRSTYIFDVDNGMTSLRSHIVKNGLRSDLIRIKRVESFADFSEGITEMLKLKPDIVVLDSATELFRVLKRETASSAGHETPDQRDWGKVLDIMEEFTVSMRNNNSHYIMTAHEWTKNDATLGIPVVRPSFQGRFAEEYGKHFSWIARYEMVYSERAIEGQQKKETVIKRRLNFGPHPQMHHKDRSGVMNRLEKPDIDNVLDRMIASTTATAIEKSIDADDSDS